MLLEISKLLTPPVVRVEIAGDARLPELMNLFDTLHDVYAADWPSTDLLFNALGMPVLPDDDVQAEAGRYLAQKLSHVRKIAAVVRPEHTASAGEEATRAAGGNLAVFHDEATALDWLRDR